jgi:hypothetical protein
MGDDARRHREAERLGFPVEVSEQHARLYPCRPPFRIDPDSFHQREVDHYGPISH